MPEPLPLSRELANETYNFYDDRMDEVEYAAYTLLIDERVRPLQEQRDRLGEALLLARETVLQYRPDSYTLSVINEALHETFGYIPEVWQEGKGYPKPEGWSCPCHPDAALKAAGAE